MGSYLDNEDLAKLISPEHAFRSPIPTQLVSNEEMLPPPQGVKQREVESRIRANADQFAAASGLSRRQFNAGMASAFIAMNGVYGALFGVTEAEAGCVAFIVLTSLMVAAVIYFTPNVVVVKELLAERDQLQANIDTLKRAGALAQLATCDDNGKPKVCVRIDPHSPNFRGGYKLIALH